MSDYQFETGFIENIETHPGLSYTDTDSIYVTFQHKEASKKDHSNWNEIINIAIDLAKNINHEIDTFAKTDLVERAGFDPNFQRLNFKTEAVALRMLQFNVKKVYALTYIYDEGKYLEHPQIKKVGGHIKKASTPKISKDIIQEIYETVLFKDFTSLEELKHEIFHNLLNKYTKIFKKHFDDIDFPYIGMPYKYSFSTKTMTKWVWGAKFYNSFFKDELRPGAGMYALTIRYNSNKLKKYLSQHPNHSQYKLGPYDILPKYDMLSVPVEYVKNDYFLKQLEFLHNEIEFNFSYDSNYDFDVTKKFDQFKPFFI